MNFWILAIALLGISAALISWPLFAGPAKDKITALFIVLMTPLAGILLYQNIGTPEAINLIASKPQQAAQQQEAHSAQQGQMNALVESLQQRMAENPDDAEGWLILGRSLKTMQRFEEAATALANVNRLTPNNPMIMIDLAETRLFASGQAQIDPEARQLIEDALAIDPTMQKGLWMMGMIHAQEGDDVTAIGYWKELLQSLDPSSDTATAVAEQIESAQLRLGEPTMAPPLPSASEQTAAVPAPVNVEPESQGFGIPVTVNISGELAGELPPNAVLFVFVQISGARGMPLAVKRLAPRGFPLTLEFTDADLLTPGSSLADFEKLDVSARISLAGVANIAPGDFQASLQTVDTKNVSAIALNLDQRVP